MDFVKPVLGYAELWPMLVVFGVACAGVAGGHEEGED